MTKRVSINLSHILPSSSTFQDLQITPKDNMTRQTNLPSPDT